MKNIAYYNGKTAPIEEMMVPMNDRACYFGDGVYDATCVVNHVPMAFDDHIDRIYRSAKLIDIEIPMEKAEMKRMLQGLVDQVEGDVLFLYWQVTRGVGMRNHSGVAARAFAALTQEGINILMISTSEIKITILIQEKYVELAVRILHDTFGLDWDLG